MKIYTSLKANAHHRLAGNYLLNNTEAWTDLNRCRSIIPVNISPLGIITKFVLIKRLEDSKIYHGFLQNLTKMIHIKVHNVLYIFILNQLQILWQRK
jgi:hypothetical protein